MSPADRSLDDDRTLVAALSFVSGGVINCCRAADTDRPVTVLLGALLVRALAEASSDASRAFCARVEMTDLNGAAMEEVLGVALRGTGAMGADGVARPLPLCNARPLGSFSGSGVMSPRSWTADVGTEAEEAGRASVSAFSSSSNSPDAEGSGMTAYTPRRVRRSLQLSVSVSDSSSESLDCEELPSSKRPSLPDPDAVSDNSSSQPCGA